MVSQERSASGRLATMEAGYGCRAMELSIAVERFSLMNMVYGKNDLKIDWHVFVYHVTIFCFLFVVCTNYCTGRT